MQTNRWLTELGYLGIEVADLSRWQRFGSEVLGLGVVSGPVAGSLLMRMDDHQYRFLLQEGPADDAILMGWQTSDVAALEDFGRHLDARGLTWAWGSDAEHEMRMVQRLLHFRDLNDLRHEVYTGPRLASDRFSSPQVAAGFVTGTGGLGHAVFGVPQPAQTIAFLQDTLGLRITDYIRQPMPGGRTFEVCFLHVNQRHHSCAIAPARPGGVKRIHHFMVEVASIDDVGFARDRCLAMGQPVHMDIGQHPNDRMVSFYGETPSGFLVEFGVGGVKLGPDHQMRTYSRLSEWGHRPNAEVPILARSAP